MEAATKDQVPSFTAKERAARSFTAIFREYGFEGASLTMLSEASGLGRSSLYHHFPKGKADMGAAALADMHGWFRVNVFDVLHGKEPVQDRLYKASDRLTKYYQSGKLPCLMEIFSRGEARALYRAELQAFLSDFLYALNALYGDTGRDEEKSMRRSEQILMRMQGALVMSRIQNRSVPFNRFIATMLASA